MRHFWIAGLVALMAFTGSRMAAVPITPLAKLSVYRTKPSVVLSWTDTNAVTVVRTDIRRRSTGADTLWKTMGYTTAKLLTFTDPRIASGKTYRYQVRDSVSGAALTAWSDSVSITIP